MVIDQSWGKMMISRKRKVIRFPEIYDHKLLKSAPDIVDWKISLPRKWFRSWEMNLLLLFLLLRFFIKKKETRISLFNVVIHFIKFYWQISTYEVDDEGVELYRRWWSGGGHMLLLLPMVTFERPLSAFFCVTSPRVSDLPSRIIIERKRRY